MTDNYDSLNVVDLISLLKEKGVKGYSNKRKHELIMMLKQSPRKKSPPHKEKWFLYKNDKDFYLSKFGIQDFDSMFEKSRIEVSNELKNTKTFYFTIGDDSQLSPMFGKKESMKKWIDKQEISRRSMIYGRIKQVISYWHLYKIHKKRI